MAGGSTAVAEEEDFDSAEPWKITAIFGMIIVVSLMVEKCIHVVEHRLQSHGRKGLLVCFHHLQQEVCPMKNIQVTQHQLCA